MRRLDVQIPAPDGHSNGTLHVPDVNSPWPGVLVFPDAGGARETFRQMGDRLASMGYVALIPDIYYRAGEWAPFDVATVFTDKQERARLSSLTSVLTNDRIIADSGGYSDFLLAGRVTATVYVAGAKDDGSFTAEQAELLESALTDAGVDHTLEFYPARHGFAVPDNPTYDTEADARHWEALRELYRAHLQRS